MSPASRLLRADLSEAILRELRRGPLSSSELQRALQVSQRTLSRTIRKLASRVTKYRIGGLRTPQYALLRELPLGLSPRQPIYRVLKSGHIELFAEVEFLAGGATLEHAAGHTRLYEGLPPYIVFAAPSGFLGRQAALQLSRSAMPHAGGRPPFPASLKDWGDDHRVAWLFTRGVNLPGNLVFGDLGRELEMKLRSVVPTPRAGKSARYLEVARTLQATASGSSAGGEQPKFLDCTEDTGHVIVKFARLGSRMAELLPLEHLALQALAETGMPASRTQLLTEGDCVFLEVQRFDRLGPTGRIGMLSAGTVDDEFFGSRDSWSEFVARCVQERELPPQAARQVDTLAAFSELIGNNDRHFENLSLLIGEDGEYLGLAPAYDILPMRYAPIGGGLDPDLIPIEPQVGRIGVEPEVWDQAARAAERFWQAAADGDGPAAGLSQEMRKLAQVNLEVARAFVAPLLQHRARQPD